MYRYLCFCNGYSRYDSLYISMLVKESYHQTLGTSLSSVSKKAELQYGSDGSDQVRFRVSPSDPSAHSHGQPRITTESRFSPSVQALVLLQPLQLLPLLHKSL